MPHVSLPTWHHNTTCVTLGQLLNLSVPPFPSLLNGDNKCNYPIHGCANPPGSQYPCLWIPLLTRIYLELQSQYFQCFYSNSKTFAEWQKILVARCQLRGRRSDPAFCVSSYTVNRVLAAAYLGLRFPHSCAFCWWSRCLNGPQA